MIRYCNLVILILFSYLTIMNSAAGVVLHKGVKYDSNGKIIDCLFCRIANRDPNEKANVVYENDEFTVFKTIAPASVHGHLLVTPKAHIKNVASLISIEDITLIENMVATGKAAYQTLGITDIQYSFHIPPWNSIDHIHLHCIAKPKEMSFFSSLKYFQGSFWCKSADDIISSLKSSNNIYPNSKL